MPKLVREKKSIVVRPLKKSDYKKWKDYYETMDGPKNPWDVSATNEGPHTREAFLSHLNNRLELRKNDSFYSLGVFERETQALVGLVMIMDVVRKITQSAYLGYCLHHDYWGKGYGKLAVAAIIDIAFRDLELHRVEAGIEPYNRRSIMLARSLGMRKEGLKKRAVFLRGEWQDLVMYSLTCEDYGLTWRGIRK